MRRANRKIKNFLENWRFYFIFFVFFSLTIAIILRFYNLQVLNYRAFSVQAASQVQTKQNNWQYLRGKIYFQDKNRQLMPVAINKDFLRLYAVPKEIKDPAATAQAIANLLQTPTDELERKFSQSNSLFALIQKKIDPVLAQKIKDLKLDGVYVDEVTGRFYPYQTLAAQVLGYVKDDEQDSRGQYGLEQYYDGYLSATNQPKNIFDLLSLSNILFSRHNFDLVSTIDYNIQSKADDLLQKAVEDWGAASGNIIVMEPKTGRLLALANFPDFDPNNYSKYPIENFINPAVELTYEPGSVFKVITIAAGLENKKLTPQTEYYDSGSVEVRGEIIRNWDLKAHGTQTMTGVLGLSLNTGAVYAEKLMGHDLFHQFVLNSGINQKTGVDLPGEVKGDVKNLKGFKDIYFATASFGQGITVTPLGLLDAIAAVANKGVMMKPYIIDKMINADNNKEEAFSPQERGRILSEENARLLRIMLVKAVDTNQVAAIKGYQVAGKTGTAQVADASGTYGQDTTHSFIGFAPAENPRFIILVKMDKPQKGKLAGATVIPVFRELAEFILNYYEIPPSL
jgi:cell division protein FtsI/penicillin-binding protein 2